MEKAKARRLLAELHVITNSKGCDQVEEVIEELRDWLEKKAPKERKQTSGSDREERGGRDRSE